jgi:hypothetical protein
MRSGRTLLPSSDEVTVNRVLASLRASAEETATTAASNASESTRERTVIHGLLSDCGKDRMLRDRWCRGVEIALQRCSVSSLLLSFVSLLCADAHCLDDAVVGKPGSLEQATHVLRRGRLEEGKAGLVARDQCRTGPWGRGCGWLGRGI